MKRCPCGLDRPYPLCCGALHAGKPAPTAESLMRARYSAFVVGDADYLLRTWASSTRPASLELPPGGEPYIALRVLHSEQGGPTDTYGEVRFEALHPSGTQREHSRFIREGGAWVYLNGTAF
ncbi:MULTISPECIES: YchJ family protein [Corynebacterium]|uniref:YchJ-like middle NTF2-like domain-containing protein n=2 Tax=Corynebacterium TaxID=1716 RepID=A0AAW5I0F2_9CORY|nr:MULTISPECIES: YchJ family metal-binding protein [Corynebacterium]MCO6395187.1 hypothetical protein [Corynebacterium lipophilum]MCQ4607943.1 hypothetical protein [Corynebacterium pseudogenitalium]MCZ2117848.1 YchJ family metal-binding protein [Corynebacterium lipophilum]MDK8243967.1 YchJ family metal-binding protein [Corynebacterium sp. UMB10321]MDK8363280.1 YchJ family metal-binding protein [Corynebacterium sp. UMB10119B]